ncbi:hypothetical protein FAZ95_02255 [Trinickia violacea]|uniref:YCII-related domain-containing protein n=1 Tax=Trinickia violacea TaxID=2571746 RepID=A0A4P8IMT2_9BURK|nr:YciI family protein [Trinickia violacea]QCP48114.1 hypothetical protein FAZ95_02255 [Trinickia violacea]
MFVIDLTYTVPLDRIDESLEAHRAFLTRHFDAGVLIAAGPKVPRMGGIMLANGVDRDELEAILATDPFAIEGLARYVVTEFKATRLAPGLNLPAP